MPTTTFKWPCSVFKGKKTSKKKEYSLAIDFFQIEYFCFLSLKYLHNFLILIVKGIYHIRNLVKKKF